MPAFYTFLTFFKEKFEHEKKHSWNCIYWCWYIGNYRSGFSTLIDESRVSGDIGAFLENIQPSYI